MSYEQMKKQISEKKPAKLYHFFGEESYLKNHYIQKLRSLLISSDTACFNYAEFEGSVTPEEFEGAALTPPLMSDKKLIYLKDTGIFSSSSAFFAEIVSDMPDYLYIIANEDKFDKRTSSYKAFLKEGVSVECVKRTPAELKLFIAREIAKQKKKISNADTEYFLEFSGNDMYSIVRAIEKLTAHSGEREIITREDIDAVLVREYMSAEYILTDALIKGDRKKVFTSLSDLFALQTDPVKLLYIISSAFLSVHKAAALLADGLSDEQITKELKLPGTFLAKKYINLASGGNISYYEKAISLIQDTDYRVKLGLCPPKTAIETLCSEILSI